MTAQAGQADQEPQFLQELQGSTDRCLGRATATQLVLPGTGDVANGGIGPAITPGTAVQAEHNREAGAGDLPAKDGARDQSKAALGGQGQLVLIGSVDAAPQGEGITIRSALGDVALLLQRSQVLLRCASGAVAQLGQTAQRHAFDDVALGGEDQSRCDLFGHVGQLRIVDQQIGNFAVQLQCHIVFPPLHGIK